MIRSKGNSKYNRIMMEILKIIEAKEEITSIKPLKEEMYMKQGIYAFKGTTSKKFVEDSEAETDFEKFLVKYGEFIGMSLEDYYIDFSDIENFLKNVIDEVESEIQETLKEETLQCYFKIYSYDDSFTNFDFILLVAVNPIKIQMLENISHMISQKELDFVPKYLS